MSISTPLQIPNHLLPPLPTNKTLTRGFHPLHQNPKTLHFGNLRKILNRANSQISEASSLPQFSKGSDVITEFYHAINRRDLGAVEGLISEGCVYEDLVFSQPFVGRKAILEFFRKFTESISEELQFVIDDISNEDSLAVGVTWHLEWKGRPFPFSKGCSFYRLEVLDSRRQIIYGRDCVEPATKPGELALVIIGGVTWILQQFPQLAARL